VEASECLVWAGGHQIASQHSLNNLTMMFCVQHDFVVDHDNRDRLPDEDTNRARREALKFWFRDVVKHMDPPASTVGPQHDKLLESVFGKMVNGQIAEVQMHGCSPFMCRVSYPPTL
jgi:hypothetical protein